MEEFTNDIKDAVEIYFKTGQYIVDESTKLKNKLNPEKGLESIDIETMLKQITAWNGSFDKISDMMKPVLKARQNSA